MQKLFGSVDCVTVLWGALYFGPGGEAWPSFQDHAILKTFLLESSLGGLYSALRFRFDYRGVSEIRQPPIWREEAQANAWRFEAKIDAAQHADLATRRYNAQLCIEGFVQGSLLLRQWPSTFYG